MKDVLGASAAGLAFFNTIQVGFRAQGWCGCGKAYVVIPLISRQRLQSSGSSDGVNVARHLSR